MPRRDAPRRRHEAVDWSARGCSIRDAANANAEHGRDGGRGSLVRPGSSNMESGRSDDFQFAVVVVQPARRLVDVLRQLDDRRDLDLLDGLGELGNVVERGRRRGRGASATIAIVPRAPGSRCRSRRRGCDASARRPVPGARAPRAWLRSRREVERANLVAARLVELPALAAGRDCRLRRGSRSPRGARSREKNGGGSALRLTSTAAGPLVVERHGRRRSAFRRRAGFRAGNAAGSRSPATASR